MRIASISGVAWVAVLAGVVMGQSAEEVQRVALEKRVQEFETSLFVDGGKRDAKGNEFVQRPEAEQRPLVAAFYKTIQTPAEKLAFLGMGDGRYAYAINKEIYGEYAARLLKDDDARVREEAVHGLGYCRLKQYGKEVEAMLKDPDVGVRVRTWGALGWFQRHDLAGRMQETMSVALDEREQVAALGAIGELLWDNKGPADQREKELKMLTPYLESTAPLAMQRAALTWMARLPEVGKYEEVIGTGMTSKDDKVRRLSLNAMTKIQSDSATEVLRGKLVDTSPQVRQFAVTELGTRKAKGLAEDVAKLLSDSSMDVRQAAIESLVALRAKDSVDAIAELMKDKSPAVRLAAVTAMGKLEGKKHLKVVMGFLGNKDEDMRQAAVGALRTIGTSDEMPAVAALAEDPGVWVRHGVLDVLTAHEARDQRAAVEKLTKDGNADVAYRAKELLKKWDKK
jgi:HEAT repeat protein